MYDIRQFKPALYALLLMGMTGFALAAEWPGLWVLSVGGILLNAWLVRTNRFTPMPRFLASIVTIIAFIYIADLVFHSSTTPIRSSGSSSCWCSSSSSTSSALIATGLSSSFSTCSSWSPPPSTPLAWCLA